MTLSPEALATARRPIMASHIAVPVFYLALSVAVFLGLAAAFLALTDSAAVDDAYIVLIYARNLAAGNGLVYTDGTRVEGFTDPLWVGLGSAGYKLGIHPLLLFRAAGIVSGLGLLIAVAVWNRQMSQVPPGFQIAPVLVAAVGPVAYWAIAGLETTTFAALTFVGTLMSVQPKAAPVLGGGIYFLAALAHPDAVVLFVPLIAYSLLAPNRRFRDAAILTLSFAIPFGLYWLVRGIYFDELFPNTFYAKGTAGPQQAIDGLAYIVRFSVPGIPLTALLLGLAMMRGLFRRPEVTLLLAQLACWLVYLTYVGGDFMQLFRFIVPIVPIVAILVQESGWLLWRPMEGAIWPRRLLVSLAVLSLAAGWTAAPLLLGGLTAQTESQARVVELGRWFGANTDSTDVIAVSAAGATPYFAERPAIDMLGLNDKHIAKRGKVDRDGVVGHKRHDADYVLSRSPEFIVLNLMEEDGQSVFGTQYMKSGKSFATLASNTTLLESPRFWEAYTRVVIPQLESHPVVFVRNDRVPELVRLGLVTESLFRESAPP